VAILVGPVPEVASYPSRGCVKRLIYRYLQRNAVAGIWHRRCLHSY